MMIQGKMSLLTDYRIVHQAISVHVYHIGLTALHLAAQCGFLEGVQMLLSAGANIDSADGKNGRTALYLAVDGNDLTMAKLLLDRGADMEHMTYSGCLPVHAAISRSNMEMVKLLEEYCSGDAIENVLRRDKQPVSHASSQFYSNSKTKDSIKHQRQVRDEVVDVKFMCRLWM